MLYDYIGVLMYSAGLIGWLISWHYIVGYELFKKLKLLYLTFIGALFVFLANIILFRLFYCLKPRRTLKFCFKKPNFSQNIHILKIGLNAHRNHISMCIDKCLYRVFEVSIR